MCEPRNRDNGASDLWTLTAYYATWTQGHFREMEWNVATMWPVASVHGCYGVCVATSKRHI